MKKGLLLILVMLLSYATFASIRTTQYRWRNDDGNETTATWKAAVNTPTSISNTSDNIRLRMVIDNDNGSAYTEPTDGILEYSYDNGATWTVMTTNAATDHFTYATSTHITHNAATTSQVTGTVGTWIAGKIISAIPNAASVTNLPDGYRTEYEWVLKPNNNTRPAATYIFRLNYWGDYELATPTLTTTCLNVDLLSISSDIRCGPGTLVLSAVAKTGVSIRWKNKQGVIVGTGNSFTTPYLTATDTFYAEPFITYNTNQICTGPSLMATAQVLPGAIVNLGNDTILCAGTGFILKAVDPYYVSWRWSTGGTDSFIMPNTTGKYWVEVLTQDGCRLSDTIQLEFKNSPHVELGHNIDTCMNKDELLFLDAQNPGMTYTWDNNYNGRVRVVDASGTYHVRVTNEYNCSSYDTIHVNIKNKPESNLPEDTSVCINMPIVLNPGNSGISYFWNTGDNTQSITTSNPGQYVVFITGRNGCVTSDTSIVYHEGEMPQFDAIRITNQGPKTFKFSTLNPQFVIGYSWDFGDGSPLVFQQSPEHTYTANGNYTVTCFASSTCGVYQDTMTVHIYSTGVDNILDENQVKVYPNPTFDNLNIQINESIKVSNIKVYNSLGQLVINNSIDEVKGKYQLDVQDLNSGNYWILITDRSNIVYKQQFVKI